MDQKFEMIDVLLEYMTSEEVLEEFIRAMSIHDVRDVVEYVARMHEIEIRQ